MERYSSYNDKFAQVAQKLDPQSRLLRAWKLEGGISAQVTALEIEQPGEQTRKVLVRQHGAADLARNPRIAADEFRLLRLLRAEGVAAPEPYLLDQSGEIFSTPYIVIEYIEGASEFAPPYLPDFLQQMTAHLARIHRLDCAKLDVTFLPAMAERYTRGLKERPARLDESLNEGKIRDVLEAAWPLPQRNPTALLHGDFWPGNLLWRDGRLVGIIDWEDAALGDPLADLANGRLEILWAFGRDAMQLFTRQYQSMLKLDLTSLPYWDLCAALRPISKAAEWAEWAADEQVMREGHRWFVEQALSSLA
jgi:aminoglycoside phosphotransferase (APT) family kinase protein